MRRLIEFVNEEYDYIQNEIHRERPSLDNRMKRECLWIMLQLLDMIPDSTNPKFIQNIYLLCKSQYKRYPH